MRTLQIVGYPRSANTYLAAWGEASGLPMAAHHHHYEFQKQRELIEQGVFTYVLVRHPRDSIASAVVRRLRFNQALPRSWRQVLQAKSLTLFRRHWHACRRMRSFHVHTRYVVEQFDLWREFHDHAQKHLLPQGAKVITFDSVIDHSVSAILVADGFWLTPDWSKEHFEDRERDRLPKQGYDPNACLGSAFTGDPKPLVRVPRDVAQTYALFQRHADQLLKRIKTDCPSVAAIATTVLDEQAPVIPPRTLTPAREAVAAAVRPALYQPQ